MLDESILSLKGIGPRRLIFFNRLNIFKKRDLLFYLPIEYLHVAEELEEGNILIKITVRKKTRYKLNFYRIVGIFKNQEIYLNYFNVIFFNLFSIDQEYFVYGLLYKKNNKFYLDSPKVITGSRENVPIYKVVSTYLFNKLVSPIIDLLDDQEIIYSNYTLKKIFFNIHNGIEVQNALKALKYLEASFVCYLFQNKLETRNKMIFSLDSILKNIPYHLSNDQMNLCNKIENILKSGFNLKYFVYGEVGSGKTLISIIASLMIINNGYTVALLAPTITLAYQHYTEILKILPYLEPHLLLLTSMSKNKKKLKERISQGLYKIIVGTHAQLYLEEIPNLGLVVIDEIHKFGVLQRSKLIDKATIKNVLMLTATPIPRSLSMIITKLMNYYELPSFYVKNTQTVWVKTENMENIYPILKNKKVYWVMPNINENEKNIGINGRFLELSKHFLNVCILHGRMKDSEKLQIVETFKSFDYGILIATTIIEIGVNIPDATVIVVENAESFGISQLHQLRGRVGRHGQDSMCILVSESKTQKIQYLKKYSSGFDISKKDLELRGSGKLTGFLQHGCDCFYFLTEDDNDIFDEAYNDQKIFKCFDIFASYNIGF